MIKSTRWSFLSISSICLATKVGVLPESVPEAGQIDRNPYTEVNYKLGCGLPFQKKCGTFSLANGCQNVNCFPYLDYDNELGIAVDINGGMKLIFDYCSQNTTNCVPTNLGRF